MNGAHVHACSSRLPHPHRFIYYPRDIDSAESYSLVDYMYQEDEHLHCRDHRSWLGTTSTDQFGRLQLDRFCFVSRSVATHTILTPLCHCWSCTRMRKLARVCLRATLLKIRRELSRMFPNP